jgi:LEA14-like dessication related protein
MNLTYEEPSVEIVSFKALPVTGFEQNFEIGLKLVNPNNFALPLNGISYQLNVADETLAHGVAKNIPTTEAYGESRFMVPVSTSLLKGIKVISALMKNKNQGINYQLKTKLDINIPFMPPLTVIQDGTIPLNQP